MTGNSDPLFNLADAVSEDIVAVAADTLVCEYESKRTKIRRRVEKFWA